MIIQIEFNKDWVIYRKFIFECPLKYFLGTVHLLFRFFWYNKFEYMRK